MKISIDVCLEEDEIVEYLSVLKEYNVKHVATKLNGPAGGWPILTLEGSEEDLKRFYVERYGEEEDFANDII